jgi:HEAT repeat protein
MTERYEPPSDFLKALISDDAPLVGGEHAEENLRCLIRMTSDAHPANRDWATLLLAQQDIDTPDVREALLRAADDQNEYVRAEAVLGLAQRDKALALPLLQRELSGDFVALPVFEAASIVAHPSLAPDLRAFLDPSDNKFLDGLAREALKACEGAEPQTD